MKVSMDEILRKIAALDHINRVVLLPSPLGVARASAISLSNPTIQHIVTLRRHADDHGHKRARLLDTVCNCRSTKLCRHIAEVYAYIMEIDPTEIQNERDFQLIRSRLLGKYLRWRFTYFDGQAFHCEAPELDGAYKVFLDEHELVFEISSIEEV